MRIGQPTFLRDVWQIGGEHSNHCGSESAHTPKAQEGKRSKTPFLSFCREWSYPLHLVARFSLQMYPTERGLKVLKG